MIDIDRRVLMRAAIEDPRFPHEEFVGQVFSLAHEDFGDGEVIRRVASHEEQHPTNLLAQTAVVPKPWNPAVDEDALLAASKEGQ